MILFEKIPNTVKYQVSYKFLDLSQEKLSDFFDKFIKFYFCMVHTLSKNVLHNKI